MFDGFFENKEPLNSNTVSHERTDKIKAAVLNELKESEDKPMKKINIVKPFIIAAAVAALGAGSLVSANAATDGELFQSFTKMFKVTVNGEEREVEGECRTYERDGQKVYEYEFKFDDENEWGYEFKLDEDGKVGDYGGSFIIAAEGDGLNLDEYGVSVDTEKCEK